MEMSELKTLNLRKPRDWPRSSWAHGLCTTNGRRHEVPSIYVGCLQRRHELRWLRDKQLRTCFPLFLVCICYVVTMWSQSGLSTSAKLTANPLSNDSKAKLNDKINATFTKSMFDTAILHADKWVFELIACHQVKKLTYANVYSYFEFMDIHVIPTKWNELFDYCACNLPSMAATFPERYE